MDHPIAPDSLERFVRGVASPAENRRIVAHLLSGCELCAAHLRRRPAAAAPAAAYDAALDRFEESLLVQWSEPEEAGPLPPPGGERASPAARARLLHPKL